MERPVHLSVVVISKFIHNTNYFQNSINVVLLVTSNDIQIETTDEFFFNCTILKQYFYIFKHTTIRDIGQHSLASSCFHKVTSHVLLLTGFDESLDS